MPALTCPPTASEDSSVLGVYQSRWQPLLQLVILLLRPEEEEQRKGGGPEGGNMT